MSGAMSYGVSMTCFAPHNAFMVTQLGVGHMASDGRDLRAHAMLRLEHRMRHPTLDQPLEERHVEVVTGHRGSRQMIGFDLWTKLLVISNHDHMPYRRTER